MKLYLVEITIIFVCLSIIITFYILSTSKHEFENPKYTIGEIVRFDNIGKSSGYHAVLTFYDNGIKYEAETNKLNGMIVGEKFKIKYESTNPEENEVLDFEPVFLKNELTDTTVGRVISVLTIGINKIRYSYKVKNKEYKKFQYYDEEKFNIKEGDKYKVEYWKKNPQRSIIYLNEQLKE